MSWEPFERYHCPLSVYILLSIHGRGRSHVDVPDIIRYVRHTWHLFRFKHVFIGGCREKIREISWRYPFDRGRVNRVEFPKRTRCKFPCCNLVLHLIRLTTFCSIVSCLPEKTASLIYRSWHCQVWTVRSQLRKVQDALLSPPPSFLIFFHSFCNTLYRECA